MKHLLLRLGQVTVITTLVILAGLCQAAFLAGAATPMSFAGAVNFAAGSNPYSVAVADLNGDGRPDVAVANRYSDNVSVLLNTTSPGAATPTFAGPTNFAVGSHPYIVVAADLNGDDRPDLAVGNRYSDSVSVLLNTTSPGAATPTFARTDFTAGDDSGSVAVADLNGDGMPDLATANLEGDNVSVLLNTTSPGAATPTFAGAVNFAAGNGPRSVAAADLNGDDMPDLAVANRNSNTVSVLLNTTSPGAAAPSFAGAVNFAAGDGPFSVMAADLNGDGMPDLATANYDGANASVLLNTTSPGAATPSFTGAVSFATDSEPGSVAATDLNSDGMPDLATANYNSNNVSVLLNTTSPGAAAPSFAGAVNFAAGDGSGSVAVADLNGDGKSDLATGNYDGNNVSVLLNTTKVLTFTKNVTPAALPVVAGQSITYTLAFTNPNLFTVTGVMVTDTIPVSVTGVSVASNVTITDTGAVPAYAWQVADLAPGASGVITITGALSKPLSPGVFTNTAIIAAPAVISREAQVGLEVACTADVTVSSVADSGPGSLRQAIADVCSGGTITFGASYTVVLTSELEINKALTIDGTGHNVTISGSGVTRVFSITGATVNLNWLAIANGRSDGSNGGGVYVDDGTLNVSNSTIFSNSAYYNGGGLWVDRNGTANITHSTIFSNSAGINGGGLAVSGTANVLNSTISGNSAGSNGGGINNDGTLAMTNTIIANSSSGGDCENTGTIGANDHNLIEDGSCNPALSGDPLLGALGDYTLTGTGNGDTQTIPLLPGSAAIDAGNAAACPATDQRGVSRTGTCDIGAFESRGFSLAYSGGSNQRTLINTAFANPLTLTVTSAYTEPVDGGQVIFTGPDSGASTEPVVYTATINGGTAMQVVTANAIVGSYVATATARGNLESAVSYNLTNILPPDVAVIKTVTPATAAPGDSITYTLIFSNAGGLDATGVVITDRVPVSVTGISVSSSGAVITQTGGSSNLVWQVANLAPGVGGIITLTGTLSEPLAAGVFTNTATITAADDGNVANNRGQAGVTIQNDDSYRYMYLPLVAQNYSSLPDLVISKLSVVGNSITVTVRNIGSDAVTSDFWLDVYFNLDAVPQINQPCDTIGADAGAVWGVTTAIPSGESLTLTVGDDYYQPDLSSAVFPANATVYGYVDSVNYSTTWGNVPESNEANNLWPVGRATSVALQAAPGADNQAGSTRGLPER